MAKTRRAFVFLTFLVSCTSVILAIVSIATENWITGEVVVSNQLEPNTKASNVYYGLFAGTFEKYILASPIKETLTTVCIVSENICMLSTQKDSDARSKEIQDLYDGKCDEYINSRQVMKSLLTQADNMNTNSPVSNQQNGTNTKLERNVKEEEKPEVTESPNKKVCGKHFLNAGLWIMTIFFLVLSLVTGVVSAMFSVVNTATNPVHQLTSIWGLYIWNGTAAGGYVLTMVMWGAQYENYIKTDVAITDTVTGTFKNNDHVYIDYSFWLMFGSMFLHIGNIGILFLRQYLIMFDTQIVKTAREWQIPVLLAVTDLLSIIVDGKMNQIYEVGFKLVERVQILDTALHDMMPTGLDIQVKDAELKLSAFVIEHNLPMLVMDHLPDLIRASISDYTRLDNRAESSRADHLTLGLVAVPNVTILVKTKVSEVSYQLEDIIIRI
ncbi:hypothetical protein CBL_10210 [Carabus blaptoides fortunei]